MLVVREKIVKDNMSTHIIEQGYKVLGFIDHRWLARCAQNFLVHKK